MGGEVVRDRGADSLAGMGNDRADTHPLDLTVTTMDLYLEPGAIHRGVELHAPPVVVTGEGCLHRSWLITAKGNAQPLGGLDRGDGCEVVVDGCAVAAARFQRCTARQAEQVPGAQHVDAASRQIELAAQIGKELTDAAVRGSRGALEDYVQ